MTSRGRWGLSKTWRSATGRRGRRDGGENSEKWRDVICEHPLKISAIHFKNYFLFLFQTFVVISKGKDIFRFSASKACYLLDPFNPIRRVAISILVHPMFSIFIITTILTNCILMIMPSSPTVESTEWVYQRYESIF